MNIFNIFSKKAVHEELPLPANPIHDALFIARYQKFSSDAVIPNRPMMVGDSITHGAETCSSLFPNVYNEGTAGDTTVDVRRRLLLISRHLPSKIFLLIGTNNLGAWVATDTTYKKDYPTVTTKLISDYLEILNYFQNDLPSADVYVQSILPINPIMVGTVTTGRNNVVIQQINEVLSYTPKLYPKCQFINLYPKFLDITGSVLDSSLTDDGLHLNQKGYEVWSEIIMPFLNN